jgi:hypothetical protein
VAQRHVARIADKSRESQPLLPAFFCAIETLKSNQFQSRLSFRKSCGAGFSLQPPSGGFISASPIPDPAQHPSPPPIRRTLSHTPEPPNRHRSPVRAIPAVPSARRSLSRTSNAIWTGGSRQAARKSSPCQSPSVPVFSKAGIGRSPRERKRRQE